MNRTRVDQHTIAERLGISVSAVSRALAGKTGVAPALRQAVLAAAREYGYVNCSGKHHKRIAVLFRKFDHPLRFLQTFFAVLQPGNELVFLRLDDAEWIAQCHWDGIIGVNFTEAETAKLSALHNGPAVAVNPDGSCNPQLPTVRPDWEAAERQATEFFRRRRALPCAILAPAREDSPDAAIRCDTGTLPQTILRLQKDGIRGFYLAGESENPLWCRIIRRTMPDAALLSRNFFDEIHHLCPEVATLDSPPEELARAGAARLLAQMKDPALPADDTALPFRLTPPRNRRGSAV